MLKKPFISILMAFVLVLAGCNQAVLPSQSASVAPSGTAVAYTASPEPTLSPDNGCKSLVIIIGDGMGQAHITAAQQAYGISFPFTKWQSVLINTDALDDNGEAVKTTDSAAAATAMASGVLTNRRLVGMNKDLEPLTTFLDLAQKQGMLTGIITTDTLLGATPSGFSAHAESRYDQETIFASELDCGIDLLCGAPHELCQNGVLQITAAGYDYRDEPFTLDELSQKKQYWQLDTLDPPENYPLLDELSIMALDHLYSKGDFILVIEQAHIDKFSHDAALDKTLHSVNMLNTTVERVSQWAEGKNTAIMVLADHETGGLTLSPEAPNTYFSLITGKEIKYEYTSKNHTSTPVSLYVKGFEPDFAALPYYGDDKLIKNSDLFYLVCSLFELS